MFSLSASFDASKKDLSADHDVRKSGSGWLRGITRFRSAPRPHILNEPQFQAGLQLEQRRLERSGRPFLLVRIVAPALFESGRSRRHALRVFASVARQTDVVGWIEAGRVLGFICTELGSHEGPAAGAVISQKIANISEERLATDVSSSIQVSVDIYPVVPRETMHFEHLRAQLVR